MRRDGITEAELAKAKAQLRARLVFDNDSVTNIAHQLGYFETIAERRRVHGRCRRGSRRSRSRRWPPPRARSSPTSNRTIGWFEPLPVGDAGSRQADARVTALTSA